MTQGGSHPDGAGTHIGPETNPEGPSVAPPNTQPPVSGYLPARNPLSWGIENPATTDPPTRTPQAACTRIATLPPLLPLSSRTTPPPSDSEETFFPAP